LRSTDRKNGVAARGEASRMGAFGEDQMIAPFHIGGLAVAALAWVVAADVADTTITFRFNDPEAPQMRQALDVFEQQNSGIKVDMQRVTWADAQQQYLGEAAVGAAPDVAQLAFRSALGASGRSPAKKIVDGQAASPSSWKMPRIAPWMV
jgi:hypothetical protein